MDSTQVFTSLASQRYANKHKKLSIKSSLVTHSAPCMSLFHFLQWKPKIVLPHSHIIQATDGSCQKNLKYKNKENRVFLYFLDFDHSGQAERGSTVLSLKLSQTLQLQLNSPKILKFSLKKLFSHFVLSIRLSDDLLLWGCIIPRNVTTHF